MRGYLYQQKNSPENRRYLWYNTRTVPPDSKIIGHNLMNDHSLTFLKQLLGIPGPSGDEHTVARFWRDEARALSDRVHTDVHDNSFALLETPYKVGPRILLAGHIDEIGVMISHVDEDGYLAILPIGGWDPQVLVGQRIRLIGRQNQELIGVIGRKPIHWIKRQDQEPASKIEDLWVDIGVKNKAEALEHVRPGCVGVIDTTVYELPNRRLVSRSIDNRIGAFIVLEVLRALAQDRPAASVAAVATTHEEISSAGATVATFHYEPHIALVVDVAPATDHPDSDKKQAGDVKLGHGPVLARGSSNSPLVFKRLCDLAEQEGIPYSLQVTPHYTSTDADMIFPVRGGVATATVSIPNRYMHSPNEMIDMADVEHTIQLMVAFVRSVQHEAEFIPE